MAPLIIFCLKTKSIKTKHATDHYVNRISQLNQKPTLAVTSFIPHGLNKVIGMSIPFHGSNVMAFLLKAKIVMPCRLRMNEFHVQLYLYSVRFDFLLWFKLFSNFLDIHSFSGDRAKPFSKVKKLKIATKTLVERQQRCCSDSHKQFKTLFNDHMVAT